MDKDWKEIGLDGWRWVGWGRLGGKGYEEGWIEERRMKQGRRERNGRKGWIEVRILDRGLWWWGKVDSSTS